MGTRIELTEREMIEAVLEAGKCNTDGPPGAVTVEMIRDETGMGTARVRKVLAHLKETKRLEVIFVWRNGLDDQLHRRPMYRLVNQEREQC